MDSETTSLNVSLIILFFWYQYFSFLIFAAVSLCAICFYNFKSRLLLFSSGKTNQTGALSSSPFSPVSTSSMCATSLSTVTRACWMLWSTGSAACQTTVVGRYWVFHRAQQSYDSAAQRQPHVPAREWKMKMCMATESVFPPPLGPETMQVPSLSFNLGVGTCLSFRRLPTTIWTRI